MPERIIAPQKGAQETFLSSSADIAIYGGSAGSGKALKIDTPILTPRGWVTMGDLRSGDFVFSPDGRPVIVKAAFDPYYTENVYELTFDNNSQIVADGGHLWHTITYAERVHNHRNTKEYLRNRREKREPRGTGKRPDLSLRNSLCINNPRPAGVSGGVKTTEDILATLRPDTKTPRANHAITLNAPIQGTTTNTISIPPYLLGAWLGDGTSSTGAITSADPEIPAAISAEGENIYQVSVPILYRVEGLTVRLKAEGLLNNKHIPDKVFNFSTHYRSELLKGLMDTDGYVSAGGQIEFSVCSEVLARDFMRLAATLGIKTHLTVSDAKLYGKICGLRYRIKFKACDPVFKLPRKLERQKFEHRVTTKLHYIVGIKKAPPAVVRCIEVDSPGRLFLAGDSLIPTHNSFSLLMEPLHYVHVPGYNATIFRRTNPEITAPGGLWDMANDLYRPLGANLVASPTMQAKFKESRIDFRHLQHEKDVYSWQGSQLCTILFDELTHFSKETFFYLLSRNRSTCGVAPYVRGTCNPDPDHWLAEFMAWYIDQDTGYPIPERSGKVRYFVRLDGEVLWSGQKNVLARSVDLSAEDKAQGLSAESMVKSFTFISASIYDNKILLKQNPGYLANLKALPNVEKEQLLYGNWKIKRSKGEYFRRHWFRIIDNLPPAHVVRSCIRGWDRAATEKTTDNNPDYTAGVLLIKTTDNEYIIADVRRFRERPAKRNAFMLETARQDAAMYKNARTVLEQDPGQAGITEVEQLVKEYTTADLLIDKVRVSDRKVTRALPLSAACENGLVTILRGAWNEAFLQELESFSNDPRDYTHDDQIDAASCAYNRIQTTGSGYNLDALTSI